MKLVVFFENGDDGLRMLEMMAWQDRAIAIFYLMNNDYDCPIQEILEQYQKHYLCQKIDIIERIESLNEMGYVDYNPKTEIVTSSEKKCQKFLKDFEALNIKAIVETLRTLSKDKALNQNSLEALLDQMLSNLNIKDKEELKKRIEAGLNDG